MADPKLTHAHKTMYWGLALSVGLVCLASQYALQSLLASTVLGDGWWRREPVFLAHQIIALPLMLLVAAIGTRAWFFPDEVDLSTGSTAQGRVYGHYELGELLCVILLGAVTLWDVPLTFHSSLYSAANMGHHVGLALMALICVRPYLMYYAPFFAGVIELSSVPLQVVDFFHPKHFADLADGSPALGKLNAAARGCFVVSFVLLRTLYFPYVVCFQERG